MTCCSSVNAQDMGMTPDRVFFSASASTSGDQVTITGAFQPTDVGKTLILYNSIPTDFPASKIWGTYVDEADLLANAPETPFRIYKANDTGRFYIWELSCSSFEELKQYETKAVEITQYIDSDTVETDYTFTVALGGLDAVMGTDNFDTLQNIVDHCLDNKLDLCIPDGDYLIVFSDTTKNRIELADGTVSSITISGESKENTRLFYEYETEIIDTVHGLSINNAVPTNDHLACINTLQVVGPDYLHKLRGFPQTDTTGGGTSWAHTHAFHIIGGNLELNSVIIEGGKLKNTTIAIGFNGASPIPGNYPGLNLKIKGSYITRCSTIGIDVQGDRPIINVADSTFYNIGLGNGEFCRLLGATLYCKTQISYSIRNTIFDSCHRHCLQFNHGDFLAAQPTYYQELINCKYFNCGDIITDDHYDDQKILGCEISGNSAVIIGGSGLIADTTFKNGSATALTAGVRTSSMDVNVANCRFLSRSAFAFNSTAADPYLTITFDNCLFQGLDTYTSSPNFISIEGKQNLVVRNSRVIESAIRFLYLTGEVKASLINNSLELFTSQHNIVIQDGNNVTLELINNRFVGNQPVKILANLSSYTKGGQITGYGNFFGRMNEFSNGVATGSPAYFQKLLGRQAYYPDTITLSTSDNFLNEVNFNYDFYKVDREGDSGTAVEIDYIAFNNASSYLTSGIGMFNGLVRIMATHDPGMAGDIIIKDNTGNIRTGTNSDYTTKQNEVLEFYYDSDTQFWNMVR